MQFINPPTRYHISDLDGMKVLNPSWDVEAYSPKCKEGEIRGDTDAVFTSNNTNSQNDERPIRVVPFRSSMSSVPRDRQEKIKQTESQRRQLAALEQRLAKGKISMKNYLHQVKAIMD